MFYFCTLRQSLTVVTNVFLSYLLEWSGNGAAMLKAFFNLLKLVFLQGLQLKLLLENLNFQAIFFFRKMSINFKM